VPPIFVSDGKSLCVSIVTSGLIINAGRLIGVGFVMITLGIVAVFVFIARHGSSLIRRAMPPLMQLRR
jgi:hypothetical protein